VDESARSLAGDEITHGQLRVLDKPLDNPYRSAVQPKILTENYLRSDYLIDRLGAIAILVRMKTAALYVCLLLGTVCGTVAESDANSGRATVVFLRPDKAGLNPPAVCVALISPEGPRTIATLDYNEKATVTMLAGRQGFVLYSLQPDALLGDQVDQYIEADLAVGRCYYVRIQINRSKLAGLTIAYALTGVVGGSVIENVSPQSFELTPFRWKAADARTSLTSPALLRWTERCREQSRANLLGMKTEAAIKKALPRLKEKFTEQYGPDGYRLFLAPEDGLEAGVTLAQAVLAQFSTTTNLLPQEDLGTPERAIGVPAALDPDDVRKAILLAAQSCKYQLVGEGPDRLAVQLIHRGTNTTFTLAYGGTPIRMYEKSVETKHPDKAAKAPERAEKFGKSVQKNLEMLDRNRSDIAEVLDEDPEKLADAPPGNPVAEIPIPSGLSLGAIQDAIVLAGSGRKFEVVSRTHGHAAIRFAGKGLVVTNRFIYDDKTIRMYTDVPRQPENGEVVGARKWVDAVVQAIQIQLDRKQL
jgi:hypothetical protein